MEVLQQRTIMRSMLGMMILVTAWNSVHSTSSTSSTTSYTSSTSNSPRSYYELGCAFQNGAYKLHTQSPEHPVWGWESNQAPVMPFANVTTFNKLLFRIKQANWEVLRDVKYNNMIELRHFYSAYLAKIRAHAHNPEEIRRQHRSFEPFFDSYHPQHSSCSSSYALAIAIYTRLVAQFPALVNYFHLIAVGAAIPRLFLMRLTKVLTKEEMNTHAYRQLWPYPYHNHVAGFFRISIAGRPGYVLLDPGFALTDPIVIMEDQQTPHHPQTRGTGKTHYGQNFNYQTSPELGPSFLLAYSSPIRPPVRGPTNYAQSLNQVHSYYIGRPYCSFLDTTVKPGLTEPRRSIEKTKSDGTLEAQVELVMFNPRVERVQPPLLSQDMEVKLILYEEGEPIHTAEVSVLGWTELDKKDYYSHHNSIFRHICFVMTEPELRLRDVITQTIAATLDFKLLNFVFDKYAYLTAIPEDYEILARQQHTRYAKRQDDRSRAKILTAPFRKMFSSVFKKRSSEEGPTRRLK